MEQEEQGHHDPSVWAVAAVSSTCDPDPQVASAPSPLSLQLKWPESRFCVLLEGRLTAVRIQTSEEITFNSFFGQGFFVCLLLCCCFFNYNFFKSSVQN